MSEWGQASLGTLVNTGTVWLLKTHLIYFIIRSLVLNVVLLNSYLSQILPKLGKSDHMPVSLCRPNPLLPPIKSVHQIQSDR